MALAPKFYEGQEFHNPDDPTAPVLVFKGGKFLPKTPNVPQAAFDDAETQVNDLDAIASRAGNLHGGMISSLMAKVPGSNAYNVNRDLDTIKSRIGFDTLSKMRAASPTGGALGAISDKEEGMLQSVMGSLDLGQNPKQLQDNIGRIKSHYTQTVPGLNADNAIDLSSGETRANLPIGMFYRDPQGNIRRNDNGDKGNPIITAAQKRQQMNDALKAKSAGLGPSFLGWEQ